MKKWTIIVCFALLLQLGLAVRPVSADALDDCLASPPSNDNTRDLQCMSESIGLKDKTLDTQTCLLSGSVYHSGGVIHPNAFANVVVTACIAKGISIAVDTAGAANNAINQAGCSITGKGPLGCCISDRESPDLAKYGTCKNEIEDCGNGSQPVAYSCCLCDIPGSNGNSETKKVADSRMTYSTCSELCKKENPSATVYPQAGAGTLPRPTAGSTGGPTLAQLQQSYATCFTQTDCALPEYGGSTSAFRAGFGCPSGQGRCVAPEAIIDLSVPFGNVKTVTGLRNYIAAGFNYGVSLAALAAAIMFVYGGFRYIFGAAYQKVQRGKEIMIDAAIGLVLMLGSITILQTVNKDTLTLKALDVYMINKQQILATKFCADIDSKQPLKFADAGARPAYTPLGQLKDSDFSVDQANTRCNVEYYAKGFNDARCDGRKCDQPGQGCVSCKSGACKEGADVNSSECISTNWTGGINFTDSAYASDIKLLAVCGKMSGATNIATLAENGIIDDGIKEIGKVDLRRQTSNQGTQAYLITFTSDDLKKATEYCQDKSGVTGFVLGLSYHDTSLLGGVDDIAIIDKAHCGGGKFSVYMDGNADIYAKDVAIMCGVAVGTRPLSNPSNYWKPEELKAAIGVPGQDTKPITCNVQLSSNNAPPDPGSKATSKTTVNVGGKDFVCGNP